MSPLPLWRGALRATAAAACTALAAGPVTGAAAGPAPFPQPGDEVDLRPNIVFVLADDLGWADVGTGRTNDGYGTTYTETPEIARLAKEGVSFDNAYASPMCVPSRANLLTGLYGPRQTNHLYQVGDLEGALSPGGRHGAEQAEGELLRGIAQGLRDGDDVLPSRAYTVAEALRDAGYATANIGKFHVASSAAEITTGFGFEENWGGSQAGHTSRYHASHGRFGAAVDASLDRFADDYTQEYVEENIAPYSHDVPAADLDALVGTPKHVTDALADATIDFIDRRDDQPFLAWLSDYAVHTPVGDKQARADLLAKYEAKPAVPGHPHLVGYSALVEGLDQALARVVDHLETTPDPRNPGHPLADNTVVVFTSDNGARRFGDRGPLRGQKGDLLEGGIRVPALVWSGNPELVHGGVVNSTPIHLVDYFPTLAALAEAEPRVRLDGADLSDIWAGRRADLSGRALFWHLPGYKLSRGGRQHPASVIRSGCWKLSYSYDTRDWDLFDLHIDPRERKDVSETYPGVTGRLGWELIDWLAEVHAPLATIRQGRGPVVVRFRGTSYANGRVREITKARTLRFHAGQELPLLLPARFDRAR